MPIDTTARQIIANAVENTESAKNVEIAIDKYIGDESVRLIDCKYEDSSQKKIGFCAAYEKIEITFQKLNSNEPEIVNFFLKIVPLNSKERADVLRETGIFLKESNFYNVIIPLFDKNGKTEKWHAECYLANENSIIMEDLKSQGYNMFGNMADDVVGLKSVLTTLAQLHSCSIILEDRLTRNSENPTTIKKLYPDLFIEMMFETGHMSNFCSIGVNDACIIAKNLNCNTEKIQEAYQQMRDLVKPSKVHRNVVCHGDLWGNNLMFRDKSPLVRECVLLDFQLSRYAPLVIDLLQFLHINTTRNFRQNYEKDMIEFYHSILDKTIRSNDPSQNIKIPRLEDIFVAMDDLRLVGLFIAAIYIPISLMDTDVITEITKDTDLIMNFFFGNRIEHVLAHMEVNENYKNRINEAVIELCEYVDTF